MGVAGGGRDICGRGGGLNVGLQGLNSHRA